MEEKNGLRETDGEEQIRRLIAKKRENRIKTGQLRRTHCNLENKQKVGIENLQKIRKDRANFEFRKVREMKRSEEEVGLDERLTQRRTKENRKRREGVSIAVDATERGAKTKGEERFRRGSGPDR